MKSKEESSFLQGVESRLDSLFAEDTPVAPLPAESAELKVIAQPASEIGRIEPIEQVSPGLEAAPDEPPAQAESFLTETKEMAVPLDAGLSEPEALPEINSPADTSSPQPQAQDKSSFISEIEKRFSAIFGEDDKDVLTVREALKPEETEDLTHLKLADEPPASKEIDLEQDEYSATPSSILDSPLKDLKSIVLSIEWEINDQILEQFEEEISKLYLLYTGNRILQGFLRILRFLGRYIRVRGVSSNQDSINLLLSVYDHLENVMIGAGMTEARKHIVLIDNIKKYRIWVENTDLETRSEKKATEATALEVQPLQMGSLEDKAPEERKADVEPKAVIELVEAAPAADQQIPEEEPLFIRPVAVEGQEEKSPDSTADTLPEIAMTAPDDKPEEKVEIYAAEPDIITQTPPAPIADIQLPAAGAPVEHVIEAMKDLPPHEAFAYALEEIKKTFQDELNTLKEEIRILKNARQG